MSLLDIGDRAEGFNTRAKLKGWTLECDNALSFQRPELIELCAMWREKAKQFGGVPPRAAFDARSMKPFLRNITIAERVPMADNTWRYRFRLYSSAMADLVGGHSGCYLEDIAPPRYALLWTECYDTVLDRPRALRFINHYEREQVNYLTGESLCAPLGEDPANPNMILSCLYVSPRKSAIGT